MHIVSTNFAKTLVWKHEYNVKLWPDVTNTARQMQMTTICYWMKPPWNFSAHPTDLICTFQILKSFCATKIWSLRIYYRWPESLFQTPTPLLFQIFWIRIRFRVPKVFKFENPTSAQTPASIIDQTEIYPCYPLRNDNAESCYCWN